LNLVNLYDHIAAVDGKPDPFRVVEAGIDHVKLVSSLTDEQRTYFKYSFVRNPFSRMVSAYEYFVSGKKIKPFMIDFSSFEHFIKRVAIIPDHLVDRHAQSQYYILHTNEFTVDFIGKFEQIDQDYRYMQEKYNFDKLPHAHKNNEYIKPWQDYYTKETADLVFQRYYQDFITFGYQQEYPSLINYIQEKHNE
jgi:chondroitin 4-sulfotransferase 11